MEEVKSKHHIRVCLVFLVCLLMTFTLTGCPSPTPDPTPTPTPTPVSGCGRGNHTWSYPNATNEGCQAKCSVCGHTGNSHSHSVGVRCSYCGITRTSSSGGGGGTGTPNACTHTNKSYGTGNNYTVQHKWTCTNCGAWSYESHYTYSDATCQKGASCICGKSLGNKVDHQYTGTATPLDTNGHSRKCQWCSATNVEVHSYGSDNKCTACGAKKNETNGNDGCTGNCSGCTCGPGSRSYSSCVYSVDCSTSYDSATDKYTAVFTWSGCAGHKVENPYAEVTMTKSKKQSNQLSASEIQAAKDRDGDYYHDCSLGEAYVYKASHQFTCKYCGGTYSREATAETSAPARIKMQADGDPVYTYTSGWNHKKTQKMTCANCNTFSVITNKGTEGCSKSLTGSKNATSHEYKCSLCGHTENEAHSFSGWSAWTDSSSTKHKATRYCLICMYEDSKEENHSYNGYISNNNGTHYQKCTACSHITSNENCTNALGTKSYTSGWYDAGSVHKKDYTQAYQKCPKCNWVKPSTSGSDSESHNSNNVSAWQYDSATHWKNLSCSVCGHSMGSANSGSHNWAYTSNNNGTHIKYCSTCNYVANSTEACAYGNYVSLGVNNGHRRTCTLCNYNEDTEHVWTGYVNNPLDYNEIDTCSKCNEHRYRNHTIDTTWNETSHTDTCRTCTYTYTGNHTYDPWEDDLNSGNPMDEDLTAGTHTRHCNYSGCGFYQTHSHNFVQTITDKPGYTKYICAVSEPSNCRCVKYKENSYTVKFDKNGGTSMVQDKKYLYTDLIILPDCSRDGYVFKGWQPYSGCTAYANFTNTDPLINGNTVYLKNYAVNLSTVMDSTVTLVAIWEHEHPIPVFDDISINGATKDSDGYWCTPVSGYNVIQSTSNKEMVYYKHTNSIRQDSVEGAVQLLNGNNFADSTSTAGTVINHTLTSQASIKATGVNDGRITLRPTDNCRCTWSDTHTGCHYNQTIEGNPTTLYFDGNAPIEDGLTSLYLEYVNTLKRNYDALDGREIVVTANDVIGNNWSGLANGSEMKITALLNPSLSKTYGKTASNTVNSRIGVYTFDTFKIDLTDALFRDGFIVTYKFIDRANNVTTGSYVFTGFNIRIEEMGSWTYRTVTSDFARGEAVYVRITTNNYTEQLTLSIPSEWSNWRYLVYQNQQMDYIEANSIAENLQTCPTSLTIDIDQTDADCDVYLIFLIPENTTLPNGTFKAVGKKGVNTKDDSRAFTVDIGRTITDGLHTVIEQTK